MRRTEKDALPRVCEKMALVNCNHRQKFDSEDGQDGHGHPVHCQLDRVPLVLVGEPQNSETHDQLCRHCVPMA
eukprot:SAG31_NODE_6212_length_2119_cov_1.734653_2_plen_73_part_00